ncbi:MAG TPA: hypothetical protein VLL30_18030, partial [Reyranella sp.]|nr:hypothetical protein [Reyranella sp.]
EFNSAVEAVRCATEIQAALATRNEHLAPEEKMLFRIGINLGDVIVQGSDLLGDGVNVAGAHPDRDRARRYLHFGQCVRPDPEQVIARLQTSGRTDVQKHRQAGPDLLHQ